MNFDLGFVVKLWRDLLTLMTVASKLESSEEQIPHNRLLINITVQSNQLATLVKSREQDRQSYAVQVLSTSANMNLCNNAYLPHTHARLLYHFLLLFFVYTSSCLPVAALLLNGKELHCCALIA